jgi:predicted regulator of Ras-like GTPase activity (Roadblock/LC7/MglB family)
VIIEDALELENLLKDIMRLVPEISYCMIVDRDGIPIMAQTKEGHTSIELTQTISALSGAMFEAAVEQGDCMNLGDIEFQLTEYSNGYVIIRGVGPGLLLVFTEKNVKVGKIFQVLTASQKAIVGILDAFICVDSRSDNMSDEMTKDLKSIFESEYNR